MGVKLLRLFRVWSVFSLVSFRTQDMSSDSTNSSSRTATDEVITIQKSNFPSLKYVQSAVRRMRGTWGSLIFGYCILHEYVWLYVPYGRNHYICEMQKCKSVQSHSDEIFKNSSAEPSIFF